MGTILRAEFEVKRNRNDNWTEVSCDYIFWHDHLFNAWLAGVRNNFGFTPLQSKPGGLPEDYSHNPEFGPGEYSFSWLSADEILNSPDQVITTVDGSAEEFQMWSGGHTHLHIREEFADFFAAVSSLRNEHDDVRMIWGFE